MNAPTPPVPAPAEVIQTGLTGASSNLAKVLKAGHFAVCVEVSPPVGPNLEAIQRRHHRLARLPNAGVHQNAERQRFVGAQARAVDACRDRAPLSRRGHHGHSQQ